MMRALLLGCAMTLMAQVPENESLGSGRRGWLFSQDVLMKMDHPGTYKVTIAYDPKPSLDEAPMSFAEGHSVVMYQDILSEEQLKTIPRNFWGGWTSFVCYSFDKNEIFAFNDLIGVVDGKIHIYPGQVQSEARKRFGLMDNQIYLGVVDGKRFYWVKGHPGSVYYFEDGQVPRKVYRLRLANRVTEPLGISKGDPQGDLALEAAAKPIRKTATPRVLQWFVLNLRDSEPVKPCHPGANGMEKELKQKAGSVAHAENRVIKSIEVVRKSDLWKVDVYFKSGPIDGMTLIFDSKGEMVEKRYWQ